MKSTKARLKKWLDKDRTLILQTSSLIRAGLVPLIILPPSLVGTKKMQNPRVPTRTQKKWRSLIKLSNNWIRNSKKSKMSFKENVMRKTDLRSFTSVIRLSSHKSLFTKKKVFSQPDSKGYSQLILQIGDKTISLNLQSQRRWLLLLIPKTLRMCY